MNRALACLLAALLLVAGSPAAAQATRTWVSGVGDDVNPCSRTAPCKTFAGAISKTATNGEINALDPGGFGTLSITKSITIDGKGPMASALAVNTNGFLINGAGIVVTLRNLTINGASTTIGNGIRILNAAAVNIDNVTIENFGGTATNGRGISIETSTPNVRVTIQNSHIYNTNNFGIQSNPTAGNVLLTIDNVTIARGGGSAIQVRAATAAVINRASLTNNGASGVAVGLTNVTASINNSVISHNQIGVFNGLDGGAPITRLYGNVITANSVDGIRVNAGQVISHGNNAIRGNAGNEAPSSSVGTQ